MTQKTPLSHLKAGYEVSCIVFDVFVFASSHVDIHKWLAGSCPGIRSKHLVSFVAQAIDRLGGHNGRKHFEGTHHRD